MFEEENRIAVTLGVGMREESIIDCACMVVRTDLTIYV
jgi:hypothetical protein